MHGSDTMCTSTHIVQAPSVVSQSDGGPCSILDLTPALHPDGQVMLCAALQEGTFPPPSVTYFYKQVTSPSISYPLYTSCVQIHPQGRIQDGRCTPRCSQKQVDRLLSHRHVLGFQAAGRHALEENLFHEEMQGPPEWLKSQKERTGR
jgi:hypothetical protein